MDPKQVVGGELYVTGKALEVARANADAISRLARVKLDLRNETYPGVDSPFFLKLALKVDRAKLEREIVDLELARVRTQLLEQDITLEVTKEAMDLLGERGYDHTYGARPLRRIIQNLIEDPLAEGLLNSRFVPGSTVQVDVEDDLLKLDPVEVKTEELAGVS